MSERTQPEVFDTPIVIAVIADTHFGSSPGGLPGEVISALRESDLILHAGDFCSVEAYQLIAELGELRGVVGNNDDVTLQRRLPVERNFRFGDFSASMIHGHGFGRLTAQQAATRHLVGKFDIAIFGHSHRAYCQLHGETLLFNPGSPTQRRWEPAHSYGIIRINDTIDAKLHYLPD